MFKNVFKFLMVFLQYCLKFTKYQLNFLCISFTHTVILHGTCKVPFLLTSKQMYQQFLYTVKLFCIKYSSLSFSFDRVKKTLFKTLYNC